MGTVWDYLPMVVIMLYGRSQVRIPAVATGKVFSAEYAIYCKFQIYLELVSVVKQLITDHMRLPHFS